MDREAFDRLSRRVAAAATRRDALRLLLASAVAAVAGVTGSTEARKRRGRGRARNRVRGEQQIHCTDLGCVSCENKRIGGGANLTRCDLNRRIDLTGTNLGGSNLTKACLGDADLRNVSFRGANLSGTCFCGSDLQGADFRGTKATAAQLACATVACDTVLPNGKPAVTCDPGEKCCGGECVLIGSDPDNCGACGVRCGACQFCNFGRCENLADGQFDCTRAPLERVGEDSVCTAGPNTGICDGGVCNCGDGEYDAAANVCRCGSVETDDCVGAGQCCQVSTTCLSDGEVVALSDCVDCGGGGQTNLCCDYTCGGAGPDKFVCIPNAVPGVTQCDDSFEGCAFNDADFVADCSACGAS